MASTTKGCRRPMSAAMRHIRNQLEALIQGGQLADPDGTILIDAAQSVIDQLMET